MKKIETAGRLEDRLTELNLIEEELLSDVPADTTSEAYENWSKRFKAVQHEKRRVKVKLAKINRRWRDIKEYTEAFTSGVGIGALSVAGAYGVSWLILKLRRH